MKTPRTYRVQAKDRKPLVDWMLGALRAEGCRILSEPAPTEAPFRLVFETPWGERMGLIVYAFLANAKETKNRPPDEHRFQVKYGSKDGKLHQLWQDPHGLYVTLFVGINPQAGFFVSADPVLHSPTRFFVSIEFKQQHVDEILRRGWYTWERDHFGGADPVETLVGGTAEGFLRLVLFEREAMGEDPGHRKLIAERFETWSRSGLILPPGVATPREIAVERAHALSNELQLTEAEVLDLIAKTRRLKMAVRGWVAEEHLSRSLSRVRGVSECRRLDAEGSGDVSLRFEGSAPLIIECKNVLRERARNGHARVDFQRTRTSKGDPCTRFYKRSDFDVLAACLHAVTEQWEYEFALTSELDPHAKCPGRLSNRVQVDERWDKQAQAVLRRAARERHV